MKSIVFENSDNLNEIFNNYYLYLLNNNFESDGSFNYIFDVLDCVNVSSEYLKSLSFDSMLKSNGIYIPESKKIILNIDKINACHTLGIRDKTECILLYFNLLIHELTHAYQHMYKCNYRDDVSKILIDSENLKFLSNNDYNFYSLFPDEVNANLNSSIYLYNFIKSHKDIDKLDFVEHILVYYLTLGLFNGNKEINSQIRYLYKELLGCDYEDKFCDFQEIDNIFCGLTKLSSTMKDLKNCYLTQKLCFDIKSEGGRKR